MKSLEEKRRGLEAMKEAGFQLFGEIFKETLTYQIIERKLKELKVK